MPKRGVTMHQIIGTHREMDMGGTYIVWVKSHIYGFSKIWRKNLQEKSPSESIGEVFIRTHTKADGTFVNLKAKKNVEEYQRNIEERLSQKEPELLDDGTYRLQELTETEKNEIFIQSTITDERGREYGLGSLRPIYGSNKRKGGPGSSSATTFEELQEQLQTAQRQIEKQAEENS